MKLPLFIFFKIFSVLSLTNSNWFLISTGNGCNCVINGSSLIVLIFVDGAVRAIPTVSLWKPVKKSTGNK